MSSPFDFRDFTADYMSEEEDDETYDLKNDETFGDISTANDDWEEAHEQFSKLTEMARQLNKSKPDSEKENQSENFARDNSRVNNTEPHAPSNRDLACVSKNFFDALRVKDENAAPAEIGGIKMSYVSDIERDMMRSCSLQNNVRLSDVSNIHRVDNAECMVQHPPPVVMPLPPGSLAQIQPTVHLAANAPPPFAPMALLGQPPNANPLVAAAAQRGIFNPLHYHGPGLMAFYPSQQLVRAGVAHHNGLPPPPGPPAITALPITPCNTQISKPSKSYQHTRVFYSSELQKQQNAMFVQMPPRQCHPVNNSAEAHFQNQHNPRVPPKVDEYAGLMTDHDRNWLANIQLLQLNNQHPYNDDFYYTAYMCKQQGSLGRMKLAANEMKDSPGPSKPSYTPQQFENSLGKLQVGSVTAPRKIIDLDEAMNNSTSTNQATGTQQKLILMTLEHLYTLLIKAEKCLNKCASLEQIREGQDYLNSTMEIILLEDFLSFHILYPKGRRYFIKLLSLLESVQVLVKKADVFIEYILLNIINVVKRDPVQDFLYALPYIRQWILQTEWNIIEKIITPTLEELSDVLTNEFMVSVFAAIIERVDTFYETLVAKEMSKWVKLLETAANAVSNTDGKVVRPVFAVEPTVLSRHLLLIADGTDGAISDNCKLLMKALSREC